MVGSVLLVRMEAEDDFAHCEPVYFTTSNVGGASPHIEPDTALSARQGGELLDAKSIDALEDIDIIVTWQGGDYTNEVYPQLRGSGWAGYWIDAASALRMKDDAVIILDPVNMHVIEGAL